MMERERVEDLEERNSKERGGGNTPGPDGARTDQASSCHHLENTTVAHQPGKSTGEPEAHGMEMPLELDLPLGAPNTNRGTHKESQPPGSSDARAPSPPGEPVEDMRAAASVAVTSTAEPLSDPRVEGPEQGEPFGFIHFSPSGGEIPSSTVGRMRTEEHDLVRGPSDPSHEDMDMRACTGTPSHIRTPGVAPPTVVQQPPPAPPDRRGRLTPLDSRAFPGLRALERARRVTLCIQAYQGLEGLPSARCYSAPSRERLQEQEEGQPSGAIDVQNHQGSPCFGPPGVDAERRVWVVTRSGTVAEPEEPLIPQEAPEPSEAAQPEPIRKSRATRPKAQWMQRRQSQPDEPPT